MARFFFNVFDGVDIFDAVGTECCSIKAMRFQALNVARQAIMPLDENEKLQVEVLDDRGAIVGTIEFGVRRFDTD
jgi:hypothetical protein